MRKPSKYEWDEWVTAQSADAEAQVGEQRNLSGPETLEVLATGLQPVTPSVHVRQRLMASVGERSRFEWLVDKVAALLDVAVDKAKVYLESLDTPRNWQTSPFSGVSLIHVDGGPAVTPAITGFVKVESGGSFPEHGHLGEEVVLVVQGTIVLADNRTARAGDVLTADETVEHEVKQGGGPPLIYLAVVRKGIVVDGQVFSPEHPDV